MVGTLLQCLKLLKSANPIYRGKHHCIGIQHSFILQRVTDPRYDHFGSSEIVDISHFLGNTIAREIKIWQNPAIGAYIMSRRGSVPSCRGGEQAEVGARGRPRHGAKCEIHYEHPDTTM